MANRKVTLVRRCKTPDGWQRYSVVIGKNGRVKPCFVKVAGQEIEYPVGYYEIRKYVGKKLVYLNAGENAADALQELQKETHLVVAKHILAEVPGVQLVEEPGRLPLAKQLRRFLGATLDRGSTVAADVYRLGCEEFLRVIGKTFVDQVTAEDILIFRKRGIADRTIHNRLMSVIACAAMLSLSGVAAPAQSSSRSRPSGAANGQVWHMRKVDVTTQVLDLRTHGSRSIQGMTMLVPKDWSFQGQATLPPKFDCNYTIGRFNITTESPDKSTGLQVRALGASVWSNNRAALQQIQQMNQQWSGTENCQIEPTKSLADGLGGAVSLIVQNGHAVGGVEPVPGMNDQLAASTEQANRMLAQQAMQHRMPASHLSTEGGRLRFTGSLHDKPVEGWLVAIHTVRSDPSPGGPVDLSDIPLFAVMYAPQGKLDDSEKMLSAMLDSVETNPEWTAYLAEYVQGIVQIKQRTMNQVAQIYSNMAADNARAAQQQAAIRNDVQNYANKVHSSVAANRAAALDHSSQQFALHMGDQAIYSNPTTGQSVQMSNQYSHAWASTTGNTNEYILTDSPSYNPNGQAGSASWTQMTQQN
jgi:hypothetical protein